MSVSKISPVSIVSDVPDLYPGEVGAHPARGSNWITERAAYKTNAELCKECNALIPFESRRNLFCNRNCYIEHTKKQPSKSKNKPTQRQCVDCSALFYRDYGRAKRCKTCRQANKPTTLAQYKTPSSRKKCFIKQHDYKCAVCGICEWQGQKISLDLDHIDGDSNNNDLTNLRLICPNCHSQTSTYKSKNRGRGRFSRRERYAKGLSF